MQCQGSKTGGLNKLIIPDPWEEGKRKECYNEAEIEDALLKHNKEECPQTHDTPPLTEPSVSDLGLKGDGEAVEEILNGTCEPPEGLDEAAVAHLRASVSPVKDVLPNTAAPEITEEDNIEDSKLTKEHTSLSPSGLHHSLWKANGMKRELNGIDSAFRDLTFRHGKRLQR